MAGAEIQQNPHQAPLRGYTKEHQEALVLFGRGKAFVSSNL